MSLLPTATLATWTSKTTDEIEADPFALDVIDQVSGYLCFLGGHDGTVLDDDGVTLIPAWTYEPGDDQAPFDVRMLALKVIRRTYMNVDQVVQEGNIAAIGGDRVADSAALSFELTDKERAVVTKYNDAGDPEEGGQLWIQPTANDSDLSLLPVTLYVGDDEQIALETSDDPREWKIPLFTPGDPGDPNLYA